MKHEWRKHEKRLYGATLSPRIVMIPKQQFIMINGKGNPNHEEFAHKVSALFSLAYAIKTLYKHIAASQAISDYTVYPLEAIWKMSGNGEYLDKNQLEYTAMIRQPDQITRDMFIDALRQVKIKKPNEYDKEIYFDAIHDQKCIEILHIGAYDDEPKSFQAMDHFAKANNLHRLTNDHKEIYLNHEPRVEKDKLKTILRYCVDND